MRNDELMHYGVLGMKWGVRKYQRKDGTLTPKGRVKYLEKARKYEAKANTSVANNYLARSRKAKLQRAAKDLRSDVRRSDLKKAKNTKDMSNQELKDAIERIELKQKLSSLQPKQVSKGMQATKYILKNFVEPTLRDTGVKYVEKYLKKKLGISDPYEDLKKEVSVLNLKKQKKEYTDFLNKEDTDYDILKKYVDYNDLLKRQTQIDEYFERLKKKKS